MPVQEPAQRLAPTGPPVAAHVPARSSSAGRPVDGHARQAAVPSLIFNSVVCAVAGAPTDGAARYQAAMLASPGAVELVPATQLTRDGLRALGDGCHGHDLLVLGGGAAAFAALEQALIPT